MYCNVLVARPFDKVFTYESLENNISVGQVVIVQFGKSIEIGIIWEKNVKKPNYKIKKISKIIDKLLINKTNLDFIKWITNYTLAPIGLVLKLFLVNKDIVESNKVLKSNLKIKLSSVQLNKEQENAKKNILSFINSSKKPVVLEGVTGSGKTEVYFDIIENQINLSKQVLIMVPEISLTPQLETRFKKRFGVDVDIWHSKISKKRRKEIWHQSQKKNPMIIIGARSSLFLPLTNLGLIIVDEEHDPSYKQEDNIRYQARDLAVVRSKIQKCNIILASATPSLETVNNIRNKKYEHVFLSKQYSGIPLPSVQLVDLSKNKLEKNIWLSEIIKKEIKSCLSKNEQVLIFLNRRGYSPLSICNKCGYRYQCSHCSAWMVMHQTKKRLLCHHCGSIWSNPEECPKCLSKNNIKFIGPGVERVAEELSSYFSSYKTLIMSSDLMNTQKKIEDFIDKVTNKKVDIIVATQIMAKGYDFPNISLVGIVDADAGLFGGDLRAIEKTFNLLQQVSGRAGRKNKTGKVMIQTYFPNQSVIKAIEKRDRLSFINQTLKERESFKMPPFGFLTSIIVSGYRKLEVENFSKKIANFKSPDTRINLIGPVEAPISLLRGKFRYRILLKGNNRTNLNNFTKKIISSAKIPPSVKVIIDVDPYTFS